jgi:hypothetical protein
VEKKMKKNEGKRLKQEAMVKFEIAGGYFEKIDVFQRAAQCFYTIKNYQKAAVLFEKGEMYQQAAECQMTIGNFSKAAKMFEECGLYLRSFECYEYEKDWEGLLQCLYRNKNKFLKYERDSLINRYVPVALNSIYHIISEKGFDEENRGKVIEEKYIKKDIDVIQEEIGSNYSESEDEEEDKIVEETKEQEKKVKIEETKNDKDEEEIITTTKEKPSEPYKKKDELNESNLSSFSIISSHELKQDFDHLSNFDPEDEFLQSEQSYSIIGSVLTKDEEALSEYSDFSIISNSRLSQIKGGNMLESDRDIYIEDVAMQKIIYFISLFSEDVKRYLVGLRSKDGLLTMDDTDAKIDFLELELDNIDEELVKLILDVLEHFDMFRLCLIVCNRYNMKEHVSRYLTSICFKYSNLKLLDTTKVLKMNDPNFRSNQKQVNVLSNEAIHGMLKLIDPKMMEQQKTEELIESSKLMSAECWRYLFYLGFWKKLIYVMDTHTSLELCYTIRAFEDFKTVYLINYRPDLSNEEIKELIQSKRGNWMNDGESPLVEYLGRKVALEESTETLDNFNLNDDCVCNILLNECLKLNHENDLNTALEKLNQALIISDKRFKNISNSKTKLSTEGKENDEPEQRKHHQSLLQLFDIFLFYGRIFKEKLIRNLIKELMARRYCIRHRMITISNFLVSLIDSPSKFTSILTPTEITVILQGIFHPNHLRVPSPSKLFLNTLSEAFLHRTSPFYKLLDGIISELKGDRYNREFCMISQEYFQKIRKFSNTRFRGKQRVCLEYHISGHEEI